MSKVVWLKIMFLPSRDLCIDFISGPHLLVPVAKYEIVFK